ncbi:MAG: hypothetical protein LBS31_02650 [Candidatus Adiutrix sp.]|jgi:hypothetical protein|nr:hypothetical protein [Candidatus Adiutrix sp.]
MQVAANSYNSLGRLGPHYERPEFRPPATAEQNGETPSRGMTRGDRSTLSVRNAAGSLKKAGAAAPAGKPNLEQVRVLIADTAGLIRNLAPYSTSHSPHAHLPQRLMTPVYV